MSARIKCPGCGAQHRVVERMMGGVVRCPKCSEKFQVPSKSEFQEPVSEDAEVVDIEDHDALAGHPDAKGFVIPHASQEPLPMDAVLPPADGDAEDEAEPPPLPRKKRDEAELDMTPMVDVTFLLLIFFMVTASFSLQKSIAMPRSQSDQPSTNTEEQEEDDFETVTVEIDEFNGYLIIASDFERECTSKLAITSGLREAFNASAGGMRLAITCHEKAKLQSLVDVMDAGTIANYTELQITEVEELY